MNDLIKNFQEGFIIAKKTIKDYVDEAFWLFGLNGLIALSFLFAVILIAAGVAISVPPVIILPLAMLIAIVYAAPITVGFYYVAYTVAQERAIKWAVFMEGIKSYWRQGYVYLVGNLIFVAVMWNSLNFYRGRSFEAVALGLWIVVMFFWLALQFYFFPVMFERDDPNLWQNLRSTLIVILGNWGVTIVLIVLWSIIAFIVAYFFFPGVFFALSLAALAGSEAVVYIARKERRRRGEDDERGAE